MAVLKVKFKNILCFDDFEADFSYPKKLVNSNLDNECFKNYPNIRYKKLNIVVGSNATGKTSLGKAIWKTFCFLLKKESNFLLDMISNIEKEAYIMLDCAFPDGIFFRFEARIGVDKKILVKYQQLSMRADDSYDTIIARLDKSNNYFVDYVQGLEGNVIGGWIFKFPSIELGNDIISCHVSKDEQNVFANILKNILKSFDSLVDDVYPSIELEDSYIVTFLNGNKPIAITNGEKLSEIKTLSSGSKYAVNIADIIYSIKKHKNGFYFVDEQFSYVDPDLEIACLVTMVNLLDDGEQLFFTTHNREILALPFPNHSFNFLRKVNSDGGVRIEMINAGKMEKRNNVNIKNLYDNDFFEVSADTSHIFELGEK